MAVPDAFARKASGLVRNLSSFDALNVSISICSPLQGVLWAWTYGPFMFQQMNLVLSYFLGIIAVALGGGLTYTLLTIAMPRSGGDYVWFSRSVHPLYGFAINWFLTFCFLNWFAMNCATMGPFFLGSVFYGLGMNNVAVAVSSFTGTLVLGTISVILSTILLATGMRVYAVVWKIIFWVMAAGFVVFVGICLSTPNSAFIEGFNKAMVGTTTYQEVINNARDLGWIPGWTLAASVSGLVFPVQNYGWGGYPAYVAGEIRDIKRSAWIGVIGALLVMGAWYVLTGGLIYNTVGYDFVHALAYTYMAAPNKYPLPYPPYPQNYLFFMTDNRALITIVAVTWLLSGIYLTPPQILIASRNIFAWSFDRLVPTALSRVSGRGAAPLYAILACGILGEILTILVVITSYGVMIMSTFLVMEIVFCLVGIATIALPYTKKSMFERMPGVVTHKVLGVPILSLSGIVLLALSAFMVYTATTAQSLGIFNFASIVFNLAVLLAAVVYYGATYYYHKSKGTDISIQFKEVPPD